MCPEFQFLLFQSEWKIKLKKLKIKLSKKRCQNDKKVLWYSTLQREGLGVPCRREWLFLICQS
jgi:hypothetical protein